jgi:hypothetical protein
MHISVIRIPGYGELRNVPTNPLASGEWVAPDFVTLKAGASANEHDGLFLAIDFGAADGKLKLPTRITHNPRGLKPLAAKTFVTRAKPPIRLRAVLKDHGLHTDDWELWRFEDGRYLLASLNPHDRRTRLVKALTDRRRAKSLASPPRSHTQTVGFKTLREIVVPGRGLLRNVPITMVPSGGQACSFRSEEPGDIWVVDFAAAEGQIKVGNASKGPQKMKVQAPSELGGQDWLLVRHRGRYALVRT